MFFCEYCEILRIYILKNIYERLLLIFLWKRIDTAKDWTTEAKKILIMEIYEFQFCKTACL